MSFFVLPVVLLAGAPSAQSDGPADPADSGAKVPQIAYRSAFERYQPYADQDLRDWRKSNDEVGMAGANAGQRPGQEPGGQTSKPQPGKPESSGGPDEKSTGAPSRQGHGGHK